MSQMSQDIQLSAADRQHIGERIKAYRGGKSLTQPAFGKLVGTSGQTIGNAERGVSVVSVELLKRITDAAGIALKPANSQQTASTEPQPDSLACESKSVDVSAFKPPLDRHYLWHFRPKTGVVIVGYTGVSRGKFKTVSNREIHLSSKGYDKYDLLLIARDWDWDIVKSNLKLRNSVKALALKPETNLTKTLDTEKYLKPFIEFTKKDGGLRKAVLVKVVLRNGLVITCKMLKRDRSQLVCSVEKDGELALILIFKHAILSVEKAKSGRKA